MIAPLCLLLALAAQPTVMGQRTPSSQAKPDWSDCGLQSYTKCFCLNPVGNTLDFRSTTTVDECKNGAQNKFYTEDSAVFQFQMSGQSKGRKLIIDREGTALFGCELEAGTVKLIGDPDLIAAGKIALFEDRSRFEEGYSLCAVKVERVSQLIKKLSGGPLEFLRQFVKLIISDSESKEHEFLDAMVGLYFTKTRDPKCNPYAFKTKSSSDKFHILPVMNRDRDTLNCDNYEPSYKLKYAELGKEGIDAKELKCEPDSSNPNSFFYMIDLVDPTTGTPTGEKKDFKEPELYEFYCAAPVSEICPDPGCADVGCPTFQPGSPGSPAALKCLNDKWYIEDHYYENQAGATCRKDLVSQHPNSVTFMIDLQSEKDKKVEGARCFTDYVCTKKSPLQAIGKVEVSEDSVKCTEAETLLTILDVKANATRTEKTITCDKSTGMWTNGTHPVAIPSRVTCIENKEMKGEAVKAALEKYHVYLIIAGSLLLAIIISLSITKIYYYVQRNRASRLQGQGDFESLTREGKITFVKGTFEKVMKADPTNTAQLIHGVKVVALLLDTETSDPKCWDYVYPFLMRIHGVILNTDHPFWHMYSRYLFLEAKKIIDKHGWTCKKPIRNKTKNKKGLMRVVAIKLLALCLNDDTCNEEAGELLEEGFRQLGFDAFDQYPHCGVLWSVIIMAGTPSYKKKNDATIIRDADIEKMVKTLHEFATKEEKIERIPDDEVIPEFGPIFAQAAFALGNSPNLEYHRDIADKMTLAEVEMPEVIVAKSYFDGLCHSLCTNQAGFILFAYQMWPDPKPDIINGRLRVAPEKEWDEITVDMLRLLTYYGKYLDAKRIEVRLMPNVTHPSPFLNELQVEQDGFVRSLEKQLEDLREWYAGHTDKPELKEKPVYKFSDKIKLDNKRVQNASEPKPGSGSDSKSASSSANSPAPAAPVVPAANESPAPAPATPVVPAPAPAAT